MTKRHPNKIQEKTRHEFVKHGCPWRATKSKCGKIFKSYILTLLHPKGHVMSAKCDEPIDELAVQVWLLYHHPNFKCCTLLYAGRNYGQTDGQTIRLLDAPGGPFRPGENGTLSAKMVPECTICILFSKISRGSPSEPLFRRTFQSCNPTAVSPLI